MNNQTLRCLQTLCAAGIKMDDALALRRISMTLHRWHELECGWDTGHASGCIARGKKTGNVFEYDGSGKAFAEMHPHSGGKTIYLAIPDRERGALKRLDKIMARYPGFVSYVQGDPRGCALYILRPEDVAKIPDGANGDVGSYYHRGIAVHK